MGTQSNSAKPRETASEAPVGVRRHPRQERSSSTVEQVLAGASRLLGQVQMEEITTSLIAREAGLSVGALYRFFPDKQSIVRLE